ncbi:hypothetical protein [Paractinoplanes rishiriensis]|uniref:Uncharacterized protein n=1 Tax=Paractinoplanes rishiriensis TaxID=1050105 RepID=A0A919MUC1_9ACTN|nr:hypothetical protein [Actinoplanes rishiriensis]GIE95633.1 hypothetical protein Ari01nite_30980 [Actinoplanes rishiriensis]
MGAGTAGAVAVGPMCAMAGPARAVHAATPADRFDRFGRIFTSLPPFLTEVDQRLRDALVDGRRGGILDAADNLAAGPIQLILDPALSLNNPDTRHRPGGHVPRAVPRPRHDLRPVVAARGGHAARVVAECAYARVGS